MSLSLQASADGLSVELLLGATVIGQFSAAGIEAGALLASDAEAQGLSSLTKLLSPEKLGKAFKGANQLLSGSGYQKLPGGLIIQWGTVTSSGTSSNNASINFPIAFPTGCLNAYTTPFGSGGDLSNLTIQTLSDSLTQFKGTTLRNGTIATGVSVRWLAIGY